MASRYICNKRIRLGGKIREPGDIVVYEPWMKIGPAEKMGIVSKVDDEGNLPAPARARAGLPEDLESLKKAELVDLVEGLGFDTDDVEGTGSGGLVTKADLVTFLNDRR